MSKIHSALHQTYSLIHDRLSGESFFDFGGRMKSLFDAIRQRDLKIVKSGSIKEIVPKFAFLYLTRLPDIGSRNPAEICELLNQTVKKVLNARFYSTPPEDLIEEPDFGPTVNYIEVDRIVPNETISLIFCGNFKRVGDSNIYKRVG